MPVLVPMSDLRGLSRPATVLAYQFGAGLTDLVTPTNGTVIAVTAEAGVPDEDWLSSSRQCMWRFWSSARSP